MNANCAGRRTDEQRGVAAVELALILVLSSFILPVVFLFSRVFYHYNVLKQATQDAANYMASVPRIELITSSGMSAAKARAEKIVADAVAGSGIKPPEELEVEIRCNNAMCFSSVPVNEVQVSAGFILFDDFWRDTGPWLKDEYGPSWTFTASSSATFRN